MALYDDVAWLPDWPGVPYGDSEGQLITAALGNNRALLLGHHGLLTTGRELAEAVYLAVVFERAAQLQLLAGPPGTITTVDHELSVDARARAHTHTLDPLYAVAHFNYYVRLPAPQ